MPQGDAVSERKTIRHEKVLSETGHEIGFVQSEDGGRWWQGWVRSGISYTRVGGLRTRTLAESAVRAAREQAEARQSVVLP